MTRAQFLARRAVAEHVKRHGVTHCQPGQAETLPATFRTWHKGRPDVGRVSGHSRDEAGAPVPRKVKL